MKKSYIVRVVIVMVMLLIGGIVQSQNAYYNAKYYFKYKPTITDRKVLRDTLKVPEPILAYFNTILLFYKTGFSDALNYDSLTTSNLDSLNHTIAIYETKRLKAIKITDSILAQKMKQRVFECELRFRPEALSIINLDKVRDAKKSSWTKGGVEKIPVLSNYDLPTEIIKGTADFLIDRIKKELTLAFFDKFKEKLDSIKELNALLPNTYALLNTKDIFQIPTMGETWKGAFENDIRNLVPNFEKMVFSLDKYDTLRTDQQFKLFMVAYHMADMLSSGVHPANAISAIDNEYGCNDNENDSIGLSMRMLNLISRNLLSVDSVNVGWVKTSEFIKLNETEREYFIKLLYYQDEVLFRTIKVDTGVGQKVSLKDILQKTRYVEKFNRSMQLILLNIEHIDALINQILEKNLINQNSSDADKAKSYQESIDKIISFTQLSSELIEVGYRLKYFTDPMGYYGSTFYNEYKPVIVSSVSVLSDIRERNYGKAVADFLILVGPFLQKSLDVSDDHVVKIKEEIIKKKQKGKDQSQTVTIILTFSNDSCHNADENRKSRVEVNELLKYLSYYGGFLVDILTADSAVQIKQILDKYAEPVGSYKIARKSINSGGLTAYPGLYGGYGTNFATDKSKSFVNGITAPIGFSFNWAFSKVNNNSNPAYDYGKYSRSKEKYLFKNYTGHSFSMFFSVVDIGAVLCYRWASDSTKGFPEKIKFEQIFAPGLQLVWGMKNVPLVLMAGAQYTPLLRSIEGDKAIFRDPNYWRIGLTLAVDIPIFTMYSKTNKYKN